MKKTIYILTAFTVYCTCQATAQSDSTVVTLNQCIEAALTNNPGIKRAANEASISAIGIRIAQSGLYPVVSVEASGGLSNEYRLGNDYKIGAAKLTADLLLWQKGKVQSSIEQSRYISVASVASLESGKQEIIVSVKTVYFNCIQEVQFYRIALENVSKAELYLKYASERYKTGAGRNSDALKAESDLAEAEFERDSYLSLLKQAQNELSMLTGLSINSLSKQEDILQIDNPELYNKLSDSLIALAFQNYPELQIINNLKLSQQAKIQETKADRYPRISVNSGYNWNYNPAIQEQKGWYSVIALRWNIFNGNEQSYRLQSEKLKNSSYENQADELKNFLIKEVSNRIISIKEAENQINLSHSLMKSTAINLEMAEAQFKAGTGSMLELTDARINNLLAKQKNIQALTALQIALANLERLIGNTYENKK